MTKEEQIKELRQKILDNKNSRRDGYGEVSREREMERMRQASECYKLEKELDELLGIERKVELPKDRKWRKRWHKRQRQARRG